MSLFVRKMSLQKERAVAIAAVKLACRSSVRIQAELCSEETISKKDRSPVTIADYAAQALVIHNIFSHFPEDLIVGEESAKPLQKNPGILQKLLTTIQEYWVGDLNEQILVDTINLGAKKVDHLPKRWWTLDPIDGTLGFLRKGQYAVALALMEGNKPILGVLGCPALPVDFNDPEGPKGCLFVAVRGQGTFMQLLDKEEEKQIHVNDVSEGKDAVFTESFESSHSDHGIAEEISRRLGIQKQPIRIDSQCKYGLVARGDATIYFRLASKGYTEKVWDHAAGSLVVEEAGGKVCDLQQRDISYLPNGLTENSGLIVTNQKFHSSVLSVVHSVFKEKL